MAVVRPLQLSADLSLCGTNTKSLNYNHLSESHGFIWVHSFSVFIRPPSLPIEVAIEWLESDLWAMSTTLFILFVAYNIFTLTLFVVIIPSWCFNWWLLLSFGSWLQLGAGWQGWCSLFCSEEGTVPGSSPVPVSQTQVAISWGNPCTRREGAAIVNVAAHCWSFLRMGISCLTNFIENLSQAKKPW